MYKMSTGNYGNTIRTCWERKVPLFVYGGPGIGKSEIPRQVFKQIAKDLKKEYVEWVDTTQEQKQTMIANPDKYFVFCDQRVGQMDSTDLRGIPNMVNTECLETIPFSWVIYFTQEKAHGAIFFDELNLAPPTVAGQAYQIINERAVSDRALGKDVFVFGAGNRECDMAHTFVMPFPLRDRFCEFEVEPNVEDWTKWATGNVNPHLVAFINWKESYLYHVDKNAANKSSTPRSVVRASRLMGDNTDITSNEAFELVSISCGEGFAAQFQAYCKHYKALNWDNIYKKPSTVRDFEVDRLWAVIGGMAEQFNKLEKVTGKDANKARQNKFELMMDVVMEMQPDFAVVGLKMMKDTDSKRFGGHLKACKKFDDIVERYVKYIID